MDLFSFLFKDDNFDEKKILQTAKPRIFPDLKWQKRKNDPHIDYGRQKLDFALKNILQRKPAVWSLSKENQKNSKFTTSTSNLLTSGTAW